MENENVERIKEDVSENTMTNQELVSCFIEGCCIGVVLMGTMMLTSLFG